MEVLAVVLGERKDSGNRTALAAAAAQAMPCPSSSMMHHEATDIAGDLPGKGLGRNSLSGSLGGNYISLWAPGSTSMRRSIDEPPSARAFMHSVSANSSQMMPPQLGRASAGQLNFIPGSSVPTCTTSGRSSSGALQHSLSVRVSGEYQPVSPPSFSPTLGRASMDGATSIALAASRRLQAEMMS